MKVLIVGSGGREHVLAWKIAQSPELKKLYAAPGNAGIADLAECAPIKADDIDGLLAFARKNEIDLTVVGPEAPLVDGIVDRFQQEGLRIFGPTKAAALLEGSKAHSKELMTRFYVPTAHYEVFSNVNEAKHYLIEAEMPIVIKADGLAAGKGVVICKSSQEAMQAITQMMSEGLFGEAGHKVVVEDLLEGEEVSLLALTDGERIIPLASAQDHKRAYDHDRGPNTGGMGAYSPWPKMTPEMKEEIVNLTIKPIIQGLAKDGTPYRGVIYAGIMMTKEGPFVLEYNCRFGDPEAQAVLPRLKSDLLPLLYQIADGRIETEELEWHEKACMTVVVASGGYPGHYETGHEIKGLDALKGRDDVAVFHAGTSFDDKKKVVTSGGRVFAVSATGDNLRAAFDTVYQAVGKVTFEHSFYRRDIGRRVLEVLR